MSPLEEIADRIAMRFVARMRVGQMRHPWRWIDRVSTWFGMNERSELVLIVSRVVFYLEALKARDAAVEAAMAEKPAVLQ